MQVLWLFGLSLLASLTFMSFLWCFYRSCKNAGIVDIGWPFAFIVTVFVALVFGSPSTIDKVLLPLMVFPWALRLAWHLWDRFNIKIEDLRYTHLREKWGGDPTGIKFYGLFLLQGLLVALISIPFYLITLDGAPGIGLFGVLGFLVSIVAFLGEFLSDYQLREFKKFKFNRGKICDVGLWSLSRHPNYFFEWLFWVGIFIYSLESEYGLAALIAPALMYYLLRYLSGIPLLEAHLSRTRGKIWRKYETKVPIFFPKFSNLKRKK